MPVTTPEINKMIAALPSREELTPELRKLEDIAALNDYALRNPNKVFNDDFKEQRKHLTEETWKAVIQANPDMLDSASDKWRKIPNSNIVNKYQGQAFSGEVREAINEDGVKLAGLAAAVPGAIIGGTTLALPILSQMVYQPGTFLAETVGGTVGGLAGGAATDAITRGVSDYNSFADMVASNSTIPEQYAEMLNPGMLLGGIGGAVGGNFAYNAAKPIVQRAAMPYIISRQLNKNIDNAVLPVTNVSDAVTTTFTPTLSAGKTSYKFYERPSALTQAERLGIPKGERKKLGNFKSSLDWTAHKWMKNNVGGYSIEDVMALQSHIPEYLQIEKKYIGTPEWLKTKSGKSYIDDPRGWILLLSKNGQLFEDSPIYTGIKTGSVDPEYDGIFWGTYDNGYISLYQARAYAPNDNSVLELTVPKNIPTHTQTHDGNTSWFSLGGKENPLLTNDIVELLFNKLMDRVNIKNIIDMGPNTGSIGQSKYNKLFDYTSRQGIIDEKFNAKFPQNDVIINKHVPRKSVHGNNGNFNLEDKNIYRKQGGQINYLNLFK